MSNKSVIFGGLCFIVGAAAGIVVGTEFAKKRYEEEITQWHEHEIEREKLKEAKTSDDGTNPVSINDEDVPAPEKKTEADYIQYSKTAAEYNPEIETTDVEKWEEEHGMDVKIVPPMLYDPDVYPDGERENPQLYYFENDKILCTDFGDVIPDTDVIYEPFFRSEWVGTNDEGPVYLIDNINKIDYIVNRITDDSYDEWYPEQAE